MTIPTRDARRAPELVLSQIVKRFGSTLALDGADCVVRSGSVHALLGENGAGKTTLMRIAFGLLSADAGTLTLGGRPVRFSSAAEAIRAGLGMVHQHFSLVPAMTVAENVALGGRGSFDTRTAAERVRQVGEAAGLTIDPLARVADLTVQAQQRVEIIKALAREVSVLILDEPTAVLAPDEARDLLAWVRGFSDAGGSVVLITHKLADALAMADDITVLRRGRVVESSPRSAWTRERLVRAMLGDAESIAMDASPSSTPRGGPVLGLAGVTVTDARGVVRVRDVTCQVHAGEIVGIAAVEGSGQYELLRVLSGRLEASLGEVRLASAIGFVPEDRHRDAVLLDAPLRETVALRGAATARGRLPWSAIAERTTALVKRFDVRGRGESTFVRTLSGGNQQKLVLARELDPPPTALVVENPTRGLDLHATDAVLNRLRAARTQGLGVVFYSRDLDEVLSVADRVWAMYDGRVIPCDPTRESVGRAMLGGMSA